MDLFSSLQNMPAVFIVLFSVRLKYLTILLLNAGLFELARIIWTQCTEKVQFKLSVMSKAIKIFSATQEIELRAFMWP